MKKLLIFLVILLISITGSAQSKVVRNGNTFEMSQQAKEIPTIYTWKDKDGKIYPIYKSSKGSYYIKRISKKTGQEYKYYLPKEVQEKLK